MSRSIWAVELLALICPLALVELIAPLKLLALMGLFTFVGLLALKELLGFDCSGETTCFMTKSRH